MISKLNIPHSKRILQISAGICVFTIIFGFCANTGIFNLLVKKSFTLKPGRMLRDVYLKYPMPLDFRAYFFNVTNPDEVQNGAKPILKEIGPFCYDLYKERVNTIDDPEKDTLTYQPNDQYFFNSERSNGLSDNDLITILHPIYVSLVNVVERDSPNYLSIVNKALEHMFPNQTNIFLTTRVRDVLFDGMKIDCTSMDFSAMAVCSQIKLKVPQIKTAGQDIFIFSLLGDKNGTVPQTVTVKRGIQKSRELGRLIAVDNETEQNVWLTPDCNQFKGTDGWIFPPLSDKEKRLWIHSIDLCRNLNADYVEDLVVHGVPVKKYYADFGDIEKNVEDRCYCREGVCLPKGLFDVSPCLKIPIYISLPHFLRADPQLLNETLGLSPETDKHITSILFEGVFAIPLEAHIRAQFNIPLKPIEKISLMQTVPEVIIPVLWIELGVVLSGSLLLSVQSIFITFKCLTVFKYLLLVLSLIGTIIGGYFFIQKRINKVEVKTLTKNDIVLPKVP